MTHLAELQLTDKFRGRKSCAEKMMQSRHETLIVGFLVASWKLQKFMVKELSIFLFYFFVLLWKFVHKTTVTNPQLVFSSENRSTFSKLYLNFNFLIVHYSWNAVIQSKKIFNSYFFKFHMACVDICYSFNSWVVIYISFLYSPLELFCLFSADCSFNIPRDCSH